MKATSGFRHPLVRSLAWLIGSPGLLAGPPDRGGAVIVADAWCAGALEESRTFLNALDDSPGELEAAVAACKSRRLGHVAECLIAFWLERSDRFELLARNLAVRESGRTLGEFDLVFIDRREGTAVHWEMAVKFYLRRRACADFLGPEGRDTLAHKVGRIFSHQLGLGGTPAGRAALAGVCDGKVISRAFVKGWLFHPEDEQPEGDQVNPNHQRGWWRTLQEFRLSAGRAGGRYCIVERAEWIGGPLEADSGDTFDGGEIMSLVGARLASGGRALMVAQFAPDGVRWRERGRGFVVPDLWGADAAG